uniref:Venom protein n=1 Tax=Hemiscolopendra marginata TaxID=943146 RepID=A0A646QD24_9MYRI
MKTSTISICIFLSILFLISDFARAETDTEKRQTRSEETEERNHGGDILDNAKATGNPSGLWRRRRSQVDQDEFQAIFNI